MTLYTNFVHLEERVEAAMIKNFHQPLGPLETEAKKRVFCVCVYARAGARMWMWLFKRQYLNVIQKLCLTT